MSCLWDTPEFWVRSEADDTLEDMPDAEPSALADSLERSAKSYDGGLEMAALIVVDLRRRAAAGIRFWTGPQTITDVKAATASAVAGDYQTDAPFVIDVGR